jgi:hypothetical protein
MSDEIRSRYRALAHAETGGEANPWIRTKVRPPAGSSAFGPVQITRGLASDPQYFDRLSPESQAFVTDHLWPMQDVMLRYGGKDMQPGMEDWDYGQTGRFPVEQQENYKKFAKELIGLMSQKHAGDLGGFVQAWRGKDATADPAYYKRFKENYARQRALHRSSEPAVIGQQSEAMYSQ